MTKALALTAAALVFIVVATANSGGYRYGASDLAFYGPAIRLAQHPLLFPRDRPLIQAQTQWWLGDEILGATATATGLDSPYFFVVVYLVALAALYAATVAFARAMGGSWWTVTTFLALLTLRHRIAKTGANSLEGYMHPRMLAFAIGVAGFAAMARARWWLAGVAMAAAAVIHTTTGLWFIGAWMMAVLSTRLPLRSLVATGAIVATMVLIVLLATPVGARFEHMDPAWLAVLAEKDYLFAADWPAYAWVINLAYPVLIVVLYRRRVAAGVAAPGERALVVGLIGLVAVFLVSVPLAEAHLARAVQMQVNRVFWLLDTAVALYVAWWLVEIAGRRAPARGAAVVAALCVTMACGRGLYILRVETGRDLFQVARPASSWDDVMRWLRSQPPRHVLADPAHGWKYGISVRLAADQDVLIEAGKDTALAMYDREVALRVADRRQALADFDRLTIDDVRTLASRYDLDVFVDTATRSFDLPVLYRNSDFIVYSLR